MGIPVRPLGPAALPASSLGFGCMSLTGFVAFKPLTDEEKAQAAKVLRRALDLGATLINTADFYGPYQNQEVIGLALKDYPDRDKVVISSKWGVEMTCPGPNGAPFSLRPDGGREWCRASVEASLKRLGVDVLDLLILRGSDPNTPLLDSVRYMKEMVDEGKVKAIGLCELQAHELRAAHAIHPITVIEQEYSLFARDMETDLLPTCRELGISVLAYSPLGRGFLTGTADKDAPPMGDHPWWTNYEKNMALVERVKALAEKKGCTAGQLALAWLMHKGDDIYPIPGTKRIECVEENCGAAAVKLTPEEMAELEAAVPHHEVTGDRWPDMSLSYHSRPAKPAET